jgi:hypothetical protein
MLKTLFSLVVVPAFGLLLLDGGAKYSSAKKSTPTEMARSNPSSTNPCSTPLCEGGACVLRLCGQVPPAPASEDTNPLQYLMAQTFIALNWPADTDAGRGVPLDPTDAGTFKTNTQGPRVWETWKQDWETKGPGVTPTDWNNYGATAPPCEAVYLRDGGVVLVDAGNWASLRQTYGEVIDKINLIAGNGDIHLVGPYVDDQGKYYHHTTHFNQALYECWRSGTGRGCERGDGGELSMPAADTTNPGAIMVKASWRELTSDELDGGTFFTRDTLLLKPGAGGTRLCHETALGLAAMHIVYKNSILEQDDQWVWASFEQRADKVPNCDGGPGYVGDVPRPVTCEPLLDAGIPTHACRLYTISDNLNQTVNADFGKLPKPWSSYRAVAMQWSIAQKPAPVIASNVKLETYFQDSACMTCHDAARSADRIWALTPEGENLNGNPCASSNANH